MPQTLLRFFFFISVTFLCSCHHRHLLEEVKIISHYPSASGVEYLDQHVYIMGDDATYCLVTGNNLQPIDSIPFFSYPGTRIPKNIKPDIESIATVRKGNRVNLLFLGSGSLSPYRDFGILYDPATKHTDSIRLDTFYKRLKNRGIEELNLEGSCSLPGAFALASRGNNRFRKNFLVLTSEQFWSDQQNSPISIILLGINTDSTVFNGVSGLAYSKESDCLLVTVSTEETSNVMDDGAIGKSYLWIIKNISEKKKWKAINPDQILDLESEDSRFGGQKIESVCITSESKKILHLLLVSDNDNGSSSVFRLAVDKK